jgi:hypothetical protein
MPTERLKEDRMTDRTFVTLETRRKCRVCGCTDARACPGGCWWVDAELCSACFEAVEDLGTVVSHNLARMSAQPGLYDIARMLDEGTMTISEARRIMRADTPTIEGFIVPEFFLPRLDNLPGGHVIMPSWRTSPARLTPKQKRVRAAAKAARRARKLTRRHG